MSNFPIFDESIPVEERLSCWHIKERLPSAESGKYTLHGGKDVYCDMNVDGGGWTMVAFISGDDQYHSNIGNVGDTYISPESKTTSKYTDAEINDFIGPLDGGLAEIRFECDEIKHFYKDCDWRATKGLPADSKSSCFKSYSNQFAVKENLQSIAACNKGSGSRLSLQWERRWSHSSVLCKLPEW